MAFWVLLITLIVLIAFHQQIAALFHCAIVLLREWMHLCQIVLTQAWIASRHWLQSEALASPLRVFVGCVVFGLAILAAYNNFGILQDLLPQVFPFGGASNAILLALANFFMGLLLAIIGAWYAFDVTDRYFRPAPDLDSVETSIGPDSFGLAYVQKEDIPVRRLARITLYLIHPRADGGASVQVRAEPRPGHDVTYECLQIPTERLDWHPEVILTVQEGKAVFDYRYESNPCPGALASANQVARETLTIIIWRNGRAVRRYPLTLVVR